MHGASLLPAKRYVLVAVPSASQVQPGPEEDDTVVPVEPVEPEEDSTPAEDDTSTDDATTPYLLWDASTVYGGNWGTFETVSWKGHNYRVKWWSQGDQPDLNCAAGGHGLTFWCLLILSLSENSGPKMQAPVYRAFFHQE